MTAKPSLWRYYQGHRYILTETPLNRRLDVAYERCERNGGHRPSGDEITREVKGQPRIFQICEACSCPYTRSRG